MPPLEVQRQKTAAYDCLYNPQRCTPADLASWLPDNAASLWAQRELLAESSSAISYRVQVGGRRLFAKQLKPRSWYHRWSEILLSPPCFRQFWAAGRVMKAGILTPVPLLSAVLRQGDGGQILVTEFCEQARGLDEFFAAAKGTMRGQALVEVADLISEFHRRGFYSRHLRSANILVQDHQGERRYWLIDLERLGSSRWLPQCAFTGTVSRGCAEFYEHLTPDERGFLLNTCFDFALKKNIYHRPSQESLFCRQARRQILRRHPPSAGPAPEA